MTKIAFIFGWILFFNTSFAAERIPTGLGEIKGTTKNYKITNNDGLADFSLVIPALNPEDLVNFDMGRIFSPDSDTISVLSFNLALPSNLSVPEQKESYFLSFTVEKNLFRAYLPNGQDYNMYAVRGQFPVSDVIKGVQNKKTLFELVNFFKFYGGGTKIGKASGGALEIKIDDIKFDDSFSIKAPAYGSGKVLLALGMVKVKGEYYPTDVKRVMAGKNEKLVIRTGADQYALSILLNDTARSFVEDSVNGNNIDVVAGLWSAFDQRANNDFTQLTYAIQKVNGTTTPTLLPQVAAPIFHKDKAHLAAAVPKISGAIQPYATHVVLYEQEAGNGIVPVSFKKELWSTTTDGWQGSFNIPPEAMALIKNKSYSFEVLFLGAEGVLGGNFSWDAVTHVTRNGVVF